MFTIPRNPKIRKNDRTSGRDSMALLIPNRVFRFFPWGSIRMRMMATATVMKLARELQYEVVEQNIPREMLYIADEVFFTGSAAEVSPISHIDDLPIGEGKRGPITEKIQSNFFDILEGRAEDIYGWLTYVPTK